MLGCLVPWKGVVRGFGEERCTGAGDWKTTRVSDMTAPPAHQRKLLVSRGAGGVLEGGGRERTAVNCRGGALSSPATASAVSGGRTAARHTAVLVGEQRCWLLTVDSEQQERGEVQCQRRPHHG
jgi:hypothetical protein